MSDFLYAYKMTADTGLAPCFQDEFLTLTCCKKDIRKSVGKLWDDWKRKSDDPLNVWVAGFASGELSDRWKKLYKESHKTTSGFKTATNCLIYLARVADAVPLKEYFGGYEKGDFKAAGRRDCVYVPVEEDGKFYYCPAPQVAGYPDTHAKELHEHVFGGGAARPMDAGAIWLKDLFDEEFRRLKSPARNVGGRYCLDLEALEETQKALNGLADRLWWCAKDILGECALVFDKDQTAYFGPEEDARAKNGYADLAKEWVGEMTQGHRVFYDIGGGTLGSGEKVDRDFFARVEDTLKRLKQIRR